MSENHDPVVAEGPTPEGECPVVPGRVHPTAGDANMQWWPRRLNLKILAKNPAVSNPMGEDFDYAEAFNSLDLAAVKRDMAAVAPAQVSSASRRSTAGRTTSAWTRPGGCCGRSRRSTARRSPGPT